MIARPLLTSEELADRWGVSRFHLSRLARDGQFPEGVVVSLGRYSRFRLAAIEEFERNGGTGAA